MGFNRFYRYDFAVTQVLTDPSLQSKYHGITVSAHILCYTPTSTIQLLNQTGKPFFVDPMTFAFARDPEVISRNGKLRRSYAKLIAKYGGPFLKCASGSPLSPSDFKKRRGELDDDVILNSCERILSFQKEGCKPIADFSKYEKLLRKGVVVRPVSPSFLVAPYFFARSCEEDWYAISLRFAILARNLKGDKELYPVICVSRDMLWNEAQISRILIDYRDFDGYIIWVDNLDEKNVQTKELDGLRLLISGLSKYGKPVYSLYGGYLCDLLGKLGLAGYSSGVCYGEKRSVDAIGGGAGNRYYVPRSHLKISDGSANEFLSHSPNNLNYMCDCPTCASIRNDISSSSGPKEYTDRFFHEMGFLGYRKHFVEVKSQEATSLEAMSGSQVLDMLDKDIQALIRIDPFPDFPDELTPSHLRVWRMLFSSSDKP